MLSGSNAVRKFRGREACLNDAIARNKVDRNHMAIGSIVRIFRDAVFFARNGRVRTTVGVRPYAAVGVSHDCRGRRRG